MTTAERVRIPRTELLVSRLCLGGNRLGGELGQAASFELLDALIEEGGNFIDTARVYADWLPDVERSCSEKTIGRWLTARHDRPPVVVATKGGHPHLDAHGTSRVDGASLRADVQASLANLCLDRLDLFYLHRDDPGLPVEEVLQALEALRAEGLIRHYAASNWSTARLAAAREAADRHGWEGFVANQPEWSLATRNPAHATGSLTVMDAAMRDFHRTTGLAAIPYSPQAKGYFEKLAAGRLEGAAAEAYDNPHNRSLAVLLAETARAAGATLTQIMLASLLRAPFATIPVVGCRTPAQLASSFASLRVDLPADVVERLWNPAPAQAAAR